MPAIQMAERLEAASNSKLNERGHTLCVREIVAGDGRATVTVSLAAHDGSRNIATRLINRRYASRGYGDNHKLGSGPHLATFAASLNDEVVGTLTLAVDEGRSLAADVTFKQELDAFRASPGVKICELIKFAFNPDVKSRHALATLFHTIFTYEAHCHGCTDVFIEVHPRHVRFYEVMLGFKQVGPAKIDATVSWWPTDVPVQLMRLNLSEMRRYMDQHAGAGGATGRSLYPCFLSGQEERVVASRIGALWDGPTSRMGIPMAA